MHPYLQSFRFSLLRFSQVPIRAFSTRIQDVNKEICATDNPGEEPSRQPSTTNGSNYTCTCPCQSALASIVRQLALNSSSPDKLLIIEKILTNTKAPESTWAQQRSLITWEEHLLTQKENDMKDIEIIHRQEEYTSKENLLLRPYRYTADDILFGRDNRLVETQSWYLGARFADCFFLSLPSHHRNSLEVIQPANSTKGPSDKVSCDASSLQTEDLTWLPNKSLYEDEVSRFSDFIQFMDYFMTGVFAQEGQMVNDQYRYFAHHPKELDNGEGKVTVGTARKVVDVPGMVLCSSGEKMANQKELSGKRSGKPSLEQLTQMQDHLADNLPKLFVKRIDYRIYRQDVVFENNYFSKPYTTTGLSAYVWQVVRMRFYAHFKYANVRIHILKITVHEEDGSIRVRWRLSGIPQTRAFMFWKFLPWSYKDQLNKESEWHDGFSTFSLDGTGVIYKHKMDRVMPDEEILTKAEPATLDTGLAA